LFNEVVNDLLSKATNESSDLIARELAKMEDAVPYLIDIFPSLNETQKIAVIQVGVFSNNKKLNNFISDIAKSDELFFVKNVAKGVLDLKLSKENDKYIQKILKRFNQQSDEDKIIDLAIIGNKGNEELITFLDSIKSNNKQVIEQKDIAKLQITSGITGVIQEYKSNKLNFSIRGLREAIYNSLPNEESVKVILEDLFKEDKETLIDTTTIILYDPTFPKEVIDPKIINRLLSIIKSDYPNTIKEKVLYILKRELKKNKRIRNEIMYIYETKSYMKKNNLINKIKNKEITDLIKDILGY